jgi:hypothetical protein
MKRILIATMSVTGLLLVGTAGSAGAAPLPDNCTKDQGTVTCVEEESPGKNKGGVGSVSTVETKGNTKNKNPEPQELEDECTQNPSKAQGGFACP